MRGVLSIYELSWEIYKRGGGGWLIAMISTDNGDNLLQRQIRYNGKIIGNERGRCNEGWLYLLEQETALSARLFDFLQGRKTNLSSR
jgi:hypothetical protein